MVNISDLLYISENSSIFNFLFPEPNTYQIVIGKSQAVISAMGIL